MKVVVNYFIKNMFSFLLENYTMRAGSQCVIMLFGTHRQPVWGKDAERFRPERWLEPDMPANPSAFVGFSLGKRSCLGEFLYWYTVGLTVVSGDPGRVWRSVSGFSR